MHSRYSHQTLNWSPLAAKCKCVLGSDMETIFWTKSRNGTKTTKIRPLIYTSGPEQEIFNYDAAPPSYSGQYGSGQPRFHLFTMFTQNSDLL